VDDFTPEHQPDETDTMNDLFGELLAAMRANLNANHHAVPLLIPLRVAPGLEPDWDNLEHAQPNVRETGVLVIPDGLWPDPTATAYSMGVFFHEILTVQ